MKNESRDEIGEFQDQVRALVIKESGAPEELIDGKGSDAGWQEFTLCEISQGFTYLKDQLYENPGCTLAGPGRGDCMHFLGLPGKPSIALKHDWPKDSIDDFGRPHGWCWSCWKDYKLTMMEKLVASYDRQDELLGTGFEGVDEVTEAIRLMKYYGKKLLRTALDEANRLANHCHDGASKIAIRNLHDAAKEAEQYFDEKP